ncbi:MAG: N-acetyltransferase [Conexibacteraceae bacterium]|nr:N-acetyltransferase [Conexibacteraceae bacterium]
MRVEVTDNTARERYEAIVDGELAGFAQYQLRDGEITIYHTEVDPRYEGQGVGSQLVHMALDDIADRGLELVPLCPFVAAYVRRHADEYLDLVPARMREKVHARS